MTEDDNLQPLRALRPLYLWVDLDLGDTNWRDLLAVAAANAATLGSSLDLSVAGGSEIGWFELADEIRQHSVDVNFIFAFPQAEDPVIFPRNNLVTDRETIEFAKAAFRESGIIIEGGSRAYFTELNRGKESMPFDQLFTITYTITPQVHAYDNRSLIENIAAQAETVRSTRAYWKNATLVVGPITLKPQSNPNATSAPLPTSPDMLPDSVDSRQLSLFGAGWTLGSISTLAAAGVEALMYYELTGWGGLMERKNGLTRRHLFPSVPGGLFPLYHVFAAIESFKWKAVAPVTLADEHTVQASAIRGMDNLRILVANLTNDKREVRVDVPGLLGARFRTLDETTYQMAATDSEFLAQPGEPLAIDNGFSVTLHPFALACIDGTLSSG